MPAPVNPRSITEAEAPWIPSSLEDLALLRRHLLAAGRSPAEASGIMGWVVAKHLGEPDGLTPSTRSRYRKILREIGPPTDVDGSPIILVPEGWGYGRQPVAA